MARFVDEAERFYGFLVAAGTAGVRLSPLFSLSSMRTERLRLMSDPRLRGAGLTGVR
jgi:hypothetical protein